MADAGDWMTPTELQERAVSIIEKARSRKPATLIKRLLDSGLLVDAELSASVIRELRQKLAIAGVEGSPPPCTEGTIQQLLKRAREAESRLARMKKALLHCKRGLGDYRDRRDGMPALIASALYEVLRDELAALALPAEPTMADKLQAQGVVFRRSTAGTQEVAEPTETPAPSWGNSWKASPVITVGSASDPWKCANCGFEFWPPGGTAIRCPRCGCERGQRVAEPTEGETYGA